MPRATERRKQNMATELLERILSDENLEEARKKVMSNKGASGIDHMTVKELPEYIAGSGTETCDRIRARKWRPMPVRRVQIPKDDGTKRDLGVPAVKDRWIEQAACQVLTPIFEKEFLRTVMDSDPEGERNRQY